jgi:homocysteine S-methyltransferase
MEYQVEHILANEQIQPGNEVSTNRNSPKLLDKAVILLDGGLGTTLEDQFDVKFSPQTPLWSSNLLISEPETLLAVQTSFSRNGADVILTATYQASFEGFARTSPGYDRTAAAEYMRSAVRIAKSSIGNRNGLVALSLGAYGATMTPSQEYTGAYGEMESMEKLFSWHLDRILPFQEMWLELDLIAFETLPRLSEVKAVRKVMQRTAMKPYWISCVFPNDDKLPDGSTIKEVVDTMLDGENTPFAIGINCTKVHKMAGLIRQFEDAAIELPRLVIYPDGAGEQVYDTTTQKWVGDVGSRSWEEEVFQIVKEVQDRGRWKGILVGGCCKTTPKHISRLKKRFES